MRVVSFGLPGHVVFYIYLFDFLARVVRENSLLSLLSLLHSAWLSLLF